MSSAARYFLKKQNILSLNKMSGGNAKADIFFDISHIFYLHLLTKWIDGEKTHEQTCYLTFVQSKSVNKNADFILIDNKMWICYTISGLLTESLPGNKSHTQRPNSY